MDIRKTSLPADFVNKQFSELNQKLQGAKVLQLQEIQKQVAEWSQKTFGDNQSNFSKETGVACGSWNALFGIQEEVGELSRTHICGNQARKGYDKPEKRRSDRIDACCDILIFLCDYAAREGFDLQEELHRTWTTIVSKRTLTNWEQHAHDKPSPVETKPGPEPVPAGIYYDHDQANFYDEKTKKGQGNEFYNKWVGRKQDFPCVHEPLPLNEESGDYRDKARCYPKTEQTGNGFAEPPEEKEPEEIVISEVKQAVNLLAQARAESKKTGPQWAGFFKGEIHDPDGWRLAGIRSDNLLTADEFLKLASTSTISGSQLFDVLHVWGMEQGSLPSLKTISDEPKKPGKDELDHKLQNGAYQYGVGVVKKTSFEWLDYFGGKVADPDGWRRIGDDFYSSQRKLSMEQFLERCRISVCDGPITDACLRYFKDRRD